MTEQQPASVRQAPEHRFRPSQAGFAWFTLLLLLVLAGCEGAATPGNAVRSAIAAAQDGRRESFLAHFEERSASYLGMFWSVSQRYGYLEDGDLQYLGSLTVEETTAKGERAGVRVTDGDKTGTLCLKMDRGRWRIDLFARGNCLQAEDTK